MKRILCISGCCCDLVFGGLPKLPEPGEEIYGTHFSMQAGGGANTAVQLSRTGVPVSFWTLIGDDLAGTVVRDAIGRSGVRLIPHRGTVDRTPVSAVLSTESDRAFASFAGPEDLLADEAALEETIRNTDAVHTFLGYCESPLIPDLCERYGVTLSVDTSFCDAKPEYCETVLPRCDYWKGNETEAKLLTGVNDVREALMRLSGIVKKGAVVTCGAQGSVGLERGGQITEQPAIDCGPFLDACGAGDAYAAGFLAGLARDEAFAACMKRGALLAGKAVTHYGGCPETAVFQDE